MRNKLFAILIVAVIVPGAVALAQGRRGAPAHNVSAKHHPNIAAAQRALAVAFEKITAAQKANEYDLSGHAAKAKELIDQAASELRLAANASNDDPRGRRK